MQTKWFVMKCTLPSTVHHEYQHSCEFSQFKRPYGTDSLLLLGRRNRLRALLGLDDRRRQEHVLGQKAEVDRDGSRRRRRRFRHRLPRLLGLVVLGVVVALGVPAGTAHAARGIVAVLRLVRFLDPLIRHADLLLTLENEVLHSRYAVWMRVKYTSK